MHSFTCQRCRLPLYGDKTLLNMSQGQIKTLLREDTASPGQSTIFGTQTEAASFIELTESIAGGNPVYNQPQYSLAQATQENEGNAMAQDVDNLERLMDFISAKTDIDLPLCSECSEVVKNGLKEVYEEACGERDAYLGLLNKLKDEPSMESQEVKELVAEINALGKENAELLEELVQAEEEKDQAAEQLAQVLRENALQSERDEEAYKKRNKYELEYVKLETERHRLEAINEYQQLQLHRLQRTNVYNDVFCIGHDGHFGTINGLRLGRLREKMVEWSEINAAWGQTLLLLTTVIHKLHIELPEYRLRPLGSMSRIDKIDLDPETGQPNGQFTPLELYSSGEYTFERLLNHKRIDSAMVALLDILHNVGKHVEKSDTNLKLPYAIEKDKIGGCSIRLSVNTSNDTWTTACKYVLTNAKWMLAYAISR